MNNSIYVRRKNKIYLEKGENDLPEEYLFNTLGNIETLGFTFSQELAQRVATLSIEQFNAFYKTLIRDLKSALGANAQYKPMYPNFPEQVKKASDDELYANAYWHYLGDWIGARIMPKFKKKRREPLKDKISLRVIDLGSKEDFNAIFTRLLSAKTSISQEDKSDIDWFIKAYRDRALDLAPKDIPLKENAAYFIARLLNNNIEAKEQIDAHIKTATDILRVACAISEGDLSLARNTKFKNISNKNRRLFLAALERIGAITEDMLRYKNRWKRLGEKLHPFEYKKHFPKTYEAFDIIRNDKPFETFNSKVEKALINKDIKTATDLLKTRPGELARRLDHLIRLSNNSFTIIAEFEKAALHISTPVLLQVRTHFMARGYPKELRVFFPKGDIAKVKAIDNELPPIAEKIHCDIISICEKALIDRFEKYKPLGKVFIDEKLKNYTVPFSQRSASKALKTISRGSRISLPNGDTIRFFIYWRDGKDRTDLDLSALALDDQSGYKMTIAYYNLKQFGGYHSGDITSAPNGASEFIDIEISKCLKKDIRYIVMIVNSFTAQPFCDLPFCFAGLMTREFPNSGEIYEPNSVENKFDLTANTRVAIPMIIDLQEREIIWTDLGLNRNPSANNNVHNNLSSITIINKAMTDLIKPNLYDLFCLHACARGKTTQNIDEADTIFAPSRGIKPTDIDILISDFL
ncbi:MAG: TerD family protein [Helicobacteraceae bacterium]|jgi:hypothetical protein|nr:TerD family protein [Helicobacteraceae bacterium]